MNIFIQEFHAFFKGGATALLFILITILTWGAMLGSHPLDDPTADTLVWCMFFSLVTSAGVTNTIFIRERLAGTLEIMLASGISKRELLFGKLLFSYLIVALMGVVTIGVAAVVAINLYETAVSHAWVMELYLTYAGAALVMGSSSAWLSLTLSNPRMTHLVNVVILAILSMIIMYMRASLAWPVLPSLALFPIATVPFIVLASRQLYRESVVQVPSY